MDPTALYLRWRAPGEIPPPFNADEMLPPPFALLGRPTVTPAPTITAVSGPTSPYADAAQLRQLLEHRARLAAEPRAAELAMTRNPFAAIGTSIFRGRHPDFGRDAVKLGNIDALYELTGHITGTHAFTTDGQYRVCDIYGGPGGFAAYVLFRRPDAMVYGLAPHGTFGWDNAIPRGRFSPFRGHAGAGNLLADWDAFGRFVVGRAGRVDLALGSATPDMIDVAPASSVSIEPKQSAAPVDDVAMRAPATHTFGEFEQTRLLVYEARIALDVLRDGGDFVCRLGDTTTEASAQWLFLMATCFETISLFKPLTSAPESPEQYLIARGFVAPRSTGAHLALTRMIDAMGTSSGLTGPAWPGTFLASRLPAEFADWLRANNAARIAEQIKAIERILTPPTDDDPAGEYNTRRALLLWNLPDDLVAPRR